MSEEIPDTAKIKPPTPERRIIPLFKGIPIPENDNSEDPSLPPLEESLVRIDEHAVLMLEKIIERVKTGELFGVAVAACFQDDKGKLFGATTYLSDGGMEEALSMTGAVSVLKRRIMDGMEGDFDEDEGE